MSKPSDANKSAAGRIFLAPQPLEAPQIWLNLGYDSYDGFQIPKYIEQFKEICTEEQYDSLMSDIKDHFEKNSLQPWCARFIVCSVFIPPLLFFSVPYSERRRREFDAGFDRIIRKHQRYWNPENSTKNFSDTGSVNSTTSVRTAGGTRRESTKKSGLLRWAYGFPLAIAPHKAYDSTGQELIATIERGRESSEEAAWPPPYYNIIFNIPQGYHYRIRNRWPGESIPIMTTAEAQKTPQEIAAEKAERERVILAEGLSAKRISSPKASRSGDYQAIQIRQPEEPANV